MRRGRGLAALTLVAISAVVAMCVYPTEHDADVFVTIDSLTLDTISRTPTSVGPLVVIQGAEGDVHATAWHRQPGGPSAPVPNVSFWVPPPAHTAPLSYIAFGAGVFGATPDTVAVIRRDIYEPNEIAPALIDLEARPFPGTVLAPLLFLNPALAFEPLPRDVLQGADWYRLRQLAQRDLTIVLSSTVPGTFQTFLTDQLTFQASDTSYHIGPDSWTFGPH